MVKEDKRPMILNFIEGFIKKRKYPPSLQEISDGCGLSGRSHADYYVKDLRDSGKITYEDYSTRTIRIVKNGEPGDGQDGQPQGN